MKKIFILLAFCLPILRGVNFSNLSAQVRLDVKSTPVSSPNCVQKYTLQAASLDTISIVEYLLDSIWGSKDGFFDNVSPGNHTIYARDSRGNFGVKSFTLAENDYKLTLFAENFSFPCDPAGYKIKIGGTGQNPPFQFKLDNSVYQTDYEFRNVAAGRHAITIRDGLGCERTQVFNVNTILAFSPKYSFEYNSFCEKPADLKFWSDSIKLQFRVDDKLPDTIIGKFSIWRNFKPQPFTLFLSNGTCEINRPFFLESKKMTVVFKPVGKKCLSDSAYTLNVTGGEAPYTFSVENALASSNDTFKLAPNRYYRVIVRDKNGCSFDGSILTPDFQPNLLNFNVRFNFKPNACGDSTGTITVRDINDYNNILAKPYQFSFEGLPFSTDTMYKNVKFKKYYDVKAKTQEGCVVTSNSYIYNYDVLEKMIITSTSFDLTNCAEKSGVLTGYLAGGARPYVFEIDGRITPPLDSLKIEGVTVGKKTIKVTSAAGCTLTKEIELEDKLFINPNFSATCGQKARLTLTVYDRSEKSILKNAKVKVNGQLGQIVNPTFTNNLAWAWDSISSGKYLVEVIDSAGCVRTDSLTLTASGLNVSSEIVNSGCADTLSAFKINVKNGTPPYKFNNDPTPMSGIDNIVKVRTGYSQMTIDDANSCRGFAYLQSKTERDSAKLAYKFVGNKCGDFVGTLTISVNDSAAARPLSISFDGRPFSSDTVFKDVNVANRVYSVIVKSREGCDLRANLYVSPTYALQLDLSGRTQFCADKSGKYNIPNRIFGGTPPFKYFVNDKEVANFDNILLKDYKALPNDFITLKVVDNLLCSDFKNVALFADCVWAGDTDTSGVVNHADLLNIGLAFGEKGTKRFCNAPDTCMTWFAQSSFAWGQRIFNGVNPKHIDGNGDGEINKADTLAVRRNWLKKHNLVGSKVLTRGEATPIFVSAKNVVAGQSVALPIMLGDLAKPANGVYGLAFSIAYDPSVLEANSVYFTHNASWLGTGDDLLSMYNNQNGRLDIALTKTSRLNATGSGQIGTLHFKVKNGTLNQAVAFEVVGQKVINNAAQEMPTAPQKTETVVTAVSSVVEPEWAAGLLVYPNPTDGNFFIKSQTTDIQQVTITDISGKIIAQFVKPTESTPLSIKQSGTFFLKIQNENGVVVRKIVKL